MTPKKTRFLFYNCRIYYTCFVLFNLSISIVICPQELFAKNCSNNQIAKILKDLKQSSTRNSTPSQIANAASCSNAVTNYLNTFKNTNEPKIRLSLVDILENMGSQAKISIPTLTVYLDKTIEPNDEVREKIAYALGSFKDLQPNVINVLISTLKNDPDMLTRAAAAYSLGEINGQPDLTLPILVAALEDRSNDDTVFERVSQAISKFGVQGKSHLETIRKLSQSSSYSPTIRLEIAKTVGEITLAITKDTSLEITKLYETWIAYGQLSQVSKELEIILKASKQPELSSIVKDVEAYKDRIDTKQQILILDFAKWWFSGFGQLFAIHALFWLTLIFLYPRSPMVQTVFFWDSRVRKIFGFPYVTSALKWISPLRRILFIPFKEPLQSDANLDLLKHQVYFADLQVKADGWKESQPISTIIPQLKGQIVLQGESGSGKSMFLRHLLNQSKKIAVYLPAQKCNEGVIAAIQTKLYGQAQDKDFLRDLIYSGAIDIYIDGLNEVNPDTRANIKEFVEKNFKSNILLSTQPLEWKPPGKVYNLQPLEIKQSKDFLEQHQPILSNSQMEHKSTKIDSYKKDCEDYLKAIELELNSDKVPSDERLALSQILSNPMELTVVAQLVANGKKPNLLYLREQQYETMDVDYKQKNQGRPFPLDSFAEMTYKLRLNSQSLIPYEDFTNEIPRLEDHKMVVRREKLGEDGKPQTQWFFRHEKIADFFIAHSFLKATDNRQAQHFADSRFRGVYLLLATLLPESKKMLLREQLIQYAAKQNDHMLSDAFVQLVGSPQFVDPQQS